MITGYELDLQMRWPAGTSERLAKRARLPHFKLPNGEIRFDLNEIKKLIQHVTPTGAPVVSTTPPAASKAVTHTA